MAFSSGMESLIKVPAPARSRPETSASPGPAGEAGIQNAGGPALPGAPWVPGAAPLCTGKEGRRGGRSCAPAAAASRPAGKSPGGRVPPGKPGGGGHRGAPRMGSGR